MFDSDPIGRQKSGVRRYSVSRSTDDWGSEESQKVMKDPQLRIAELVDTTEY
jgi:hypothetical protein